MSNYLVLAILSTTVLITHNIILLNEETLILLCFITFSWLSLKNLSGSLEGNLEAKITLIEKNLKNSLRSTIFNLQKILNIRERCLNLLCNFKSLGQVCLNFANLITNLVVSNSAKILSVIFPQKLQFTARLENQTVKLLSKLMILKLKKVIALKHFYSLTMSNNYFACSNKIGIRECIQRIKSNTK